LSRILYFISTALKNRRQNLMINLVSVGTLSLSLIILASFVLIYSNIQGLVKASARSLSVSVYIEEGLSPEELNRLKTEILSLPRTSTLTYISKAAALSELKERIPEHKELLDGLEDNPLPASFEVVFKMEEGDREEAALAVASLSNLPGVSEVDYAWEWLERLSGLLNFIKLARLIIAGLLFLAPVFIIANTIKLTVYSRKEELEIIRLLGATERFIKTPFYIEGLIQGAAGGILAIIFLLPIFTILISQISLPFGISSNSFSFLSAGQIIGLFCLSIFLGLLGSAISLRRFLS
jgi:cell division transport system permease protein